MVSLSIVIPVYHGAATIPDLAATLDTYLPTLTDTYEVIMVEDDGGDHSWDVIQTLVARYEWLRGYKLLRNYGQHNALLCGIRAARYDVIVTMDDDLQHPPHEIPKLLAKLDEGYDVVYGTPEQRQHAQGRKLGSSIIRLTLSAIMGADTARHASAFRAFRTYLRDAFANYHSPSVTIDVLLAWGTNRFTHTPVVHQERQAGASGYNFARLVSTAITMLTGFSVLPLRLASVLGFVMTAFGFALLLWIIPVRYLLYGQFAVPGFTMTASMIAIFSGVQMFTIGIIGEYIARMHFRLMDKPPYVVRESISAEDATERARVSSSG
jgi:glycosyltransferase involved in cell wall biosynthesis